MNPPRPQNPTPLANQPVSLKYADMHCEEEVEAKVHAALDPSGHNQQFSVVKLEADCDGKSLIFLVDSGSSHSFISPSTL